MTDLKTVQALVEALELGLDYAQTELRNRQDVYKGYPHRYSSEMEDVSRLEAVLTAGRALIAQMQRDAVQPGWKLVPVEPTPEMSAAGFAVSEAEHDPAGVYRAMLAAAPHPEAQALDSQLQQTDGHSTARE